MFAHNLIKVGVFLGVQSFVAAHAQTGSVAGRVGNLLTGGPVRKAQVVLSEKYRTVTDSQGKYRISGVAPGRYRLSVQRPGFLTVMYGARGPNRPGKSILVGEGEKKTDIDVQIEPPAVITGHVYDEDGEPLRIGILLWRQVWRDGRKTLEQAAGGTSDEDGEFRLYGLLPGTYLVATSQSNTSLGFNSLVTPSSQTARGIYALTFYPGTQDFQSAAPLKVGAGGEARGIDFHLRKSVAVNIRGVVVGWKPGESFFVALARLDGFPIVSVANNSNNGEFAVARVTAGSYILNASVTGAEPRSTGSLKLEVGTIDMEDVRVAMNPPAVMPGFLRVEGLVEGSAKVNRGLVQLSQVLPAMVSSAHTFAARPDEAFEWTNFAPGIWRVDVTPLADGMYLKSPRELEIARDFAGPLQVVVSMAGASVTGKVRMTEEKPVESAAVLLFTDERQPRVVRYAISEPDGSYRLRGIPPGKYRMIALEDMETSSWDDPAVANGFAGMGVAIELAASQKAVQDLAPGLH